MWLPTCGAHGRLLEKRPVGHFLLRE
jgi:hypothetical protein